MALVTVAYMLAVAWVAGISGSQVKIFSRMLGFNDFAFGIMAALPFVATFAQLLASVLIERTGLLKYQFMQCATVHRALWAVVAIIPFLLPVPSSAAVVTMMCVLGASWVMNALATPAWLTWMGRLIPRRIRGRYFGARERWGIMAQTVCVVAIGVVLDVVYDPRVGDVATLQPIVLRVISVVFIAAALCGVMDILLFHKVPEVLAPQLPERPGDDSWRRPPGRPPVKAIEDLLIGPMRDRVFRHYVLFGATMMFSITVGSWYFWLNAMENLGFSPLATQTLFLVIGPLAGVASARAWGVAIDRWGRRPVLILSSVVLTVMLLPWLFVSRQTPSPAFVADGINAASAWAGGLLGRSSHVLIPPEAAVGAYLVVAICTVIAGAAATGMNLAQVGIVLGFSDGSGQSRYVAASSVFISIGGTLGGVVGGLVTQLLKGVEIHAGTLFWNNWHAAFLVAVIARAVSVFWLAGMPEPGAVRVRYLVRAISENIFNSVASRVFLPLRAFGWRKPEHRRDRPRPRGRHPEE